MEQVGDRGIAGSRDRGVADEVRPMIRGAIPVTALSAA
jgi:hypothetical protein